MINENDVILAYDNAGRSADRYTVLYPWQPENPTGCFAALGMNDAPFHPQGIGMHCSAIPGRHLGKRITFDALPTDCQRAVMRDLSGCTTRQLATVVWHFLICAEFADKAEGCNATQWTRASVRDAIRYCAFAIAECGALWQAAMRAQGYGSHPDTGSPEAGFGHDLWLTSGGSGISFTDRDELNIPHGIDTARLPTCLDRDGKRHCVTDETLGEALDSVIYGGNTGCIAKLEARYMYAAGGKLHFQANL